MWEWYEGMHSGMAFGGFWMVLFWVAVIALIVWVVKILTERTGYHTDTSDTKKPLNITKERYAKGEIDKEEFEQLKKDLL